ncbi:MAG: hypothetical protein FWC10_03645 [Lentimicrobiaceae bacterium]|nr:hypothetical protein [Lentimicrobiaceae bacterium]
MAKKGGYNRLNYLNRCKIIIGILGAHYREGITTYSGVFRAYILPFYPMSYKSFMKMVNMRNVDKQIKEEMERIGNPTEKTEEINPNQLALFE